MRVSEFTCNFRHLRDSGGSRRTASHGLKIRWGNSRVGSSPTSGTTENLKKPVELHNPRAFSFLAPGRPKRVRGPLVGHLAERWGAPVRPETQQFGTPAQPRVGSTSDTASPKASKSRVFSVAIFGSPCATAVATRLAS